MMNGNGMMGFGAMSIYWIFWSLLVMAGVLLVVWVIFRVIRRAGSRPHDVSSTDPAIRLLRERYARGEIDQEEYMRRLENLTD